MNNPSILETINSLIIETEVKLISSLILVLLIWLLRSILLRILFQRIKTDRNQAVTRQIVGYTAFILGVVLIGRLWLEGFQSLLIVLTLVVAALVVSLKELILNIASWSVIAWRQLFGIGDRIKIGAHFGEVVETGIIYITIIEMEEKFHAEPHGHRVVRIPNSLVLTQPVINYTRGSHTLWYELVLSLSLNCNWKKAQEILLQILQRYSAGQSEAGDEVTADVLLTVRDSKILLTGRYLCDSYQHLDVEQDIWRDILDAMQNTPDITLV
jgi:small-conductance mechanosensitive channel